LAHLVRKSLQQLLHAALDFGHDFRVSGSHVVALVGIRLQIIKLRSRQRQVHPSPRRRGNIRRCVVAHEVQLPFAPASTLDIPVVEIKQRLTLEGEFLTGEQGPDIDSIERLAGELRIAEASDRRQDIDRAGDAFADRSRRNPSGKTGDEGLLHPAFIGCSLAAPQFAGASLVPRTVIAGKHDQGVLVQIVLLQGFEDLPHAPIDFPDHIAIKPLGRLASEAF
jgi:hypothetical protein